VEDTTSVILHYHISETFKVKSPSRISHMDEKEDPMIFETMEEVLGYCENIATSPLIFAFNLVESTQRSCRGSKYTTNGWSWVL
jgi:hypothetical protein